AAPLDFAAERPTPPRRTHAHWAAWQLAAESPPASLQPPCPPPALAHQHSAIMTPLFCSGPHCRLRHSPTWIGLASSGRGSPCCHPPIGPHSQTAPGWEYSPFETRPRLPS